MREGDSAILYEFHTNPSQEALLARRLILLISKAHRAALLSTELIARHTSALTAHDSR